MKTEQSKITQKSIGIFDHYVYAYGDFDSHKVDMDRYINEFGYNYFGIGMCEFESLHYCNADIMETNTNRRETGFLLSVWNWTDNDYMQRNIDRINAIANSEYLSSNIKAICCDSEWLQICCECSTEKNMEYFEKTINETLKKTGVDRWHRFRLYDYSLYPDGSDEQFSDEQFSYKLFDYVNEKEFQRLKPTNTERKLEWAMRVMGMLKNNLECFKKQNPKTMTAHQYSEAVGTMKNMYDSVKCSIGEFDKEFSTIERDMTKKLEEQMQYELKKNKQ